MFMILTQLSKAPEEMTWLIKCHFSDVSGFSASERQEGSKEQSILPILISSKLDDNSKDFYPSYEAQNKFLLTEKYLALIISL